VKGPPARRAAAPGRDMQTFLLAQAVLEHAALSAISTVVSDARYELSVFADSVDATKIVIGLGLVVLIGFLWRR
jgi:hypothetical protein